MGPTKTSMTRTVDLSADVVATLREWRLKSGKHEGLVFPFGSTYRGTRHVIGTAMFKALKKGRAPRPLHAPLSEAQLCEHPALGGGTYYLRPAAAGARLDTGDRGHVWVLDPPHHAVRGWLAAPYSIGNGNHGNQKGGVGERRERIS